MEDNGFRQRRREIYRRMQRIRPHIERRARHAPGTNYPAKLAHEWRLMMLREMLGQEKQAAELVSTNLIIWHQPDKITPPTT